MPKPGDDEDAGDGGGALDRDHGEAGWHLTFTRSSEKQTRGGEQQTVDRPKG